MSRNEVEGFQDCVIPRVVSMAGSFSGLRRTYNFSYNVIGSTEDLRMTFP